jgi:sulfoxide reductase heme-binding subunit YedZ
MTKSPWPWNDRTGRFSWLKAAVLTLEVAPAIWVAYALAAGLLGARPVTVAIHQTGLWAIRFLLLSLLVSPARALFNWHRVMLVRRQLGTTALFYALAHIVLYFWDENWVFPAIAHEILSRFYLEVGFVALLGLAVLGLTSTDNTLRRMGHAWKKLHRTVYGLAVLGLFHYFLQSKANVAEPLLAAGLFIWMMGWRLLPAGPDRQPLPVLGLSFLAAIATLAVEAAWYGFATNIGPRRPLLAETDVSFGPHPAGQVMLICLCLTIATGFFWAQQRDRWRQAPAFQAAWYAGGAIIVALLCFAFSLTDDWLPDSWPFWPTAGAFVAGAVVLGAVRYWVPARLNRGLDAVCFVVLVLPIVAGLVF